MEKPPSAPALPSTTFVQADAATFKELVQRLTGPDCPPRRSPPTRKSQDAVDAAKLSGVKRLHERRSGGSRLKVAVPKPAAGSASKPASPAVPSPASSFARLGIWKEDAAEGGDEEVIVIDEEEEERAIKERRFYLHPSPRSRTRMAEPDLLPLFPLTSPEAGDRENKKKRRVNLERMGGINLRAPCWVGAPFACALSEGEREGRSRN